jgi:adenylate cyclase
MSTELTRKLKSLALICLFGCFAGVIYQLINENYIDFRSLIVGFPLGLVFGIMELFLIPRASARLHQWPFTVVILFKAVLYTTVIFAVSVMIMLLGGLFEGRSLQELVDMALSMEQLILVIYSLVVYCSLLFLMEVNRLLGDGILWKFIIGKYHRPREEERIFMFLDMKSSTTIAEKLGHERFYRLLNELFHEISQPVLETKAEIYQYVGDEVILTWPMKEGLENSNCLKSFFMFRDNLNKHAANYQQNFGISPRFKAGLHFGKVISAQIGDVKREIVYNGDVLNTTARIQSECNNYQRDCLVSGPLMNRLNQNGNYQWEMLDTVALRGKETKMELFAVAEQ